MQRDGLNRFTASVIVDHLALSLLWLISCVGIVTAPAGTIALCQVAARRARGDDPGVAGAFLAALRQHFIRGLVLGIGWAGLGGLLMFDLVIAARIGPPAGDILLVALLALLLCYALVTAALPPAAVAFDLPPLRLLRWTALAVLLSPARAVLGLGAVAAAIAAAWTVPLSLLIVPSLTATLLHRLYRGAFHRVQAGTPAWTPTPTRATATSTPVVATRS